jgi:hypothetical protein
VGSGSDPRSTCPPRKHRIAEENVSSSHVDLRTTWSIHARHPWAGIIFYVAVRPDLVTPLLYFRQPLNRREEANHAPRTARQQWPIFVKWALSCTSGSKGSGAPLVTRSIRNGASVYPPGEGAT